MGLNRGTNRPHKLATQTFIHFEGQLILTYTQLIPNQATLEVVQTSLGQSQSCNKHLLSQIALSQSETLKASTCGTDGPQKRLSVSELQNWIKRKIDRTSPDISLLKTYGFPRTFQPTSDSRLKTEPRGGRRANGGNACSVGHRHRRHHEASSRSCARHLALRQGNSSE